MRMALQMRYVLVAVFNSAIVMPPVVILLDNKRFTESGEGNGSKAG
jgi:hypothetical protein